MKLTVPIDEDGQVDSRFGRAARMAVGTVTDGGQLADWQVYDVGWDVLHDQSAHGQHHARVFFVAVWHADAGLTRLLIDRHRQRLRIF